MFLPKESKDEYGFNGMRGDGKDLINLWKTSRKAANQRASYVTSRDQLLAVNTTTTDYLMGRLQTAGCNNVSVIWQGYWSVM